MLTTFTRIKIVAFVIIALVTVSYIGINYADLGRHVGLRDYYTVKLQLPETGGLFKGSAVSYRGVTVGRVDDLSLADGDGQDGTRVIAELRITSDTKIPSDTAAVVANRSAVGEQYVDLRPATNAGPYLKTGSTIARAGATTPPPVSETLKAINDFNASVPTDSLQTTLDELGKAFTGQGPHLQRLLDASDQFINTSHENIDTTVTFLENGNAVLRTQNQEAASLRQFARDGRKFAAALKGSDADLRRLIAVAPPFSEELSGLLRDLDPGLPRLLANLLTFARITDTRLPGMRQFFSDLPAVAAMGNTVIRGGSLEMGLINTFFNPLPCVSGYGGTFYRDGLDVKGGSRPFNSAARCTLSPSTGVNVRGAANAPHGGVPAPAKPGVGSGAADVMTAVGLPGVWPVTTGAGGQGAAAYSDLERLLGLRR
ncbi:MCE family protein [Spirillospora sp. NPDC048911]|uniref:MCE family protein n=1 Tax=Spirillospora sp. NPDC048911 TaxID=3364527 RepID=UPI003710EF30